MIKQKDLQAVISAWQELKGCSLNSQLLTQKLIQCTNTTMIGIVSKQESLSFTKIMKIRLPVSRLISQIH